MKPRAGNLLIGSTTLAPLAAGLVGLLGFRNIRQQVPLRIVFAGSASGLHQGGSVNFDGVQIGEVKSLTLDSPRRVVVLADGGQQCTDPQGHHRRRRSSRG